MEVEILDIGAACRLCLGVGANHIPIFNEAEANYSDPLSLPQRIGACVGFEVSVVPNYRYNFVACFSVKKDIFSFTHLFYFMFIIAGEYE